MQKFAANLVKLILELAIFGSLGAIVYGVHLFSIPLAFIVGGIFGVFLFVYLRVVCEEQ